MAEKQSQLDVTWDRNASAVLQAKRGVLYISDGANKRELELTGAQLRTGRVLYSRLSADVGLRLEVFGGSPDPVTESIRIVSTEAPHVVRQPTPVPTQVVREPKPAPGEVQPATGFPRPTVQESRAAAKPPEAKRAAEATPPPEVELQRPRRR